MRSPWAVSGAGSAARTGAPATTGKSRQHANRRRERLAAIGTPWLAGGWGLGYTITMNTEYAIADTSAIYSPALIFYKDVIRRNLARALAVAGSPERLRPHVKTHKT